MKRKILNILHGKVGGISMGSVKDLEVIKRPTRDFMGIGRFHFSDRWMSGFHAALRS
jgi:hypothetical protein